ncbi:chromosomal replication initiator DnaA [Stappia sp. F7233]|uniref:Chromosomal replication initiator DnaA n=1 Tax=Stappia albiluteola TaxID=2758565 RepID=A0A839AH75_9HYPH|nr:helix-turn-helix domain-containing protein [Stappia albiluteola]MBA5779053.1 chromosomal replication initiator DnaA [Stappia albiluteola]
MRVEFEPGQAVTPAIPGAICGLRAGDAGASAIDPIPVIEGCVRAVFALPGVSLHAPQRGRAEVAQARQVAMYLAHVVLGMSLTDVGRRFGRDRTTAAYACRLVEDKRDDPAFDLLTTSLEEAVGAGLKVLATAVAGPEAGQ